MATSAQRVLFRCTGNSCRSQMAEALLRHVAPDRFEALSAGSRPAGFVHPLAIEALRRRGVRIDSDAESKSWDVFVDRRIDLVITLCDEAAQEECPVWPGDPLTVHWSLPDPSFHHGSDEERIEFAVRVADRLRLKIEGLTRLDFSASRDEMVRQLAFLGEI